MSENALELEPDPELLSLQFRLQRMRRLAEREPDLEPWQLAERFGVEENQAWSMLLAVRYEREHPEDPVRAGARFGHLVVLVAGAKPPAPERRGPRRGHSDGIWCLVQCDCGTQKLARARHLRAGKTRTCGNGCPTWAATSGRPHPPRTPVPTEDRVGVCSTSWCGNPLRAGSRFDMCRLCRLRVAVAAEQVAARRRNGAA